MKIDTQRIAIPSILEVSKGSLGRVGTVLKENDFDNVVIYFGNGLIDMFGKTVLESLKESNVEVSKYEEIDTINIDDIIDMTFSMSPHVNAIIGIGGGKVLDAAKYSAFLKNIPFISIPTSTSTDGFSSANASLIINGKRTSVPAKMAYGIIVDIEVIKSSPEKFIYSGVGDLCSKITALYDWGYEAKNGHTKVDGFSMMIAKKAVNSFVRTKFNSIKDEFFIKELIDSLTLSGIAMEIAGDSIPSSGSEHLISHALDKMLDKPELHGIQVGVATYIMAVIQNHRYERIIKVFTRTGFFDYVKTLKMKKSDFEKAIDLAPTIKPARHTFLHEEKYREEAKKLLYTDKYLNDILV